MNFACPSCGFRVFNRRYGKCEHCGKDLPQELLLNREETGQLDRAAEESRLRREAWLRSQGKKRDRTAAEALSYSYYGDSSGSFDSTADCTGDHATGGCIDGGGGHGGQ